LQENQQKTITKKRKIDEISSIENINNSTLSKVDERKGQSDGDGGGDTVVATEAPRPLEKKNKKLQKFMNLKNLLLNLKS